MSGTQKDRASPSKSCCHAREPWNLANLRPRSEDSLLIPPTLQGDTTVTPHKISGGRALNMRFPLLGEILAIVRTPEMSLFYVFPGYPRPGRANTRHRCSLAFPLAQSRHCNLGCPCPSVMVNFMRQLGYATLPRYLVKHYPECSLRVFWDEINIQTGRLNKQITLHSDGEPNPTS